MFVPLDAPLYETKIDYLLEAFESQRAKRWFDRETFLGLMRIRGMEMQCCKWICRSIPLPQSSA